MIISTVKVVACGDAAPHNHLHLLFHSTAELYSDFQLIVLPPAVTLLFVSPTSHFQSQQAAVFRKALKKTHWAAPVQQQTADRHS